MFGHFTTLCFKGLITLITKNSIDSDGDLPLNKTIEIHEVTIVVRAVFHENNKYYPQVFSDECLYEL